MKKSSEEFFTLVKSECKKHKVKCDIRKGKYVKLESFKCSGYFDGGKNPVLVVAGGKPDAASILVHEYCHLTQWVDGIDLWKKADTSLDMMNKWLEGDDIPDIKEHLAVCRDLELDNERRSVKFIRKYKMGISPATYIKRANAYILFYNYLLISRKWSIPPNTPYNNKRLLKSMSTKFDMDYEKLTPEILKIFKEENI